MRQNPAYVQIAVSLMLCLQRSPRNRPRALGLWSTAPTPIPRRAQPGKPGTAKGSSPPSREEWAGAEKDSKIAELPKVADAGGFAARIRSKESRRLSR